MSESPEPSFAILEIKSGDVRGQQRFNIESELSIGRHANNNIVIPSMNVSRNHARIYKKKDRYHVEDLGSHNGTILNGRLAKDDALKNGDTISIAEVEMLFTLSTAKVDSSDAPAESLKEEDLGMAGIDSTSFIDLSELNKTQMEELRTKRPDTHNQWLDDNPAPPPSPE